MYLKKYIISVEKITFCPLVENVIKQNTYIYNIKSRAGAIIITSIKLQLLRFTNKQPIYLNDNGWAKRLPALFTK